MKPHSKRWWAIMLRIVELMLLLVLALIAPTVAFMSVLLVWCSARLRTTTSVSRYRPSHTRPHANAGA